MRKTILIYFLLIGLIASGQRQRRFRYQPEPPIITVGEIKTGVTENEKGGLVINVFEPDARKFKERGFVRYSDFGAKGDGKSEDINFIVATHEFANQNRLEVKADDDFTYYIGSKNRTASVKTNTDFGKASFIIDDTDLISFRQNIFLVESFSQSFQPEGITKLKKDQKKIDISLPSACVISVADREIKRYIRFGLNQNSGSAQTDIFIVDKDGNVDETAPIIWDFDNITEIKAMPIDETPLLIKGGIFTTIANNGQFKNSYYSRNISIRRSNVVVDGIEHRVIEEGDQGAPYSGFISAGECADITVKNCVLTGHKTYRKIGSAGLPVSMGTYDISLNRVINITFVNCRQTNDINDRTYWGILGSNYCKNITYDNCVFSRFDAHMGVTNAYIKNSTLGHQGINAIGHGTFLVENSTIYGRTLINLRSDYGSTWRGDFIIRNCKFIPSQGTVNSAAIIGGSNKGDHDFGYRCYMPKQIVIESLYIDDENYGENYLGPAIFTNFNPQYNNDSYVEEYPYIKTEKVILKDITVASKKELIVSYNKFMFKDVKVVEN